MEWVLILGSAAAVGGVVYWAGSRLVRGWDQLAKDTKQADRRDKERGK